MAKKIDLFTKVACKTVPVIGFKKFKNAYDDGINYAVNCIQDFFLNQHGLKVNVMDDDHITDRGDFYRYQVGGIYECRDYETLTLNVAFNHKLLCTVLRLDRFYKVLDNMFSGKLSSYDYTEAIKKDAHHIAGHEIGHGLVRYIKALDLTKKQLEKMPCVAEVQRLSYQKEETVVDIFGLYLAGYELTKAKHKKNILYMAMYELDKNNISLGKEYMKNYKKYVKA